MATIQARRDQHGRAHYRVQIRLQGVYRSATFPTLAEARQWAYVTEGALRAQQHFPTLDAAHHTLGELIERYGREVLPTKSPPHRGQSSGAAGLVAHVGGHAALDRRDAGAPGGLP
jgi:hypothetical protein